MRMTTQLLLWYLNHFKAVAAFSDEVFAGKKISPKQEGLMNEIREECNQILAGYEDLRGKPSTAAMKLAAKVTTKVGKALKLNNDQSTAVYEAALDVLQREVR